MRNLIWNHSSIITWISGMNSGFVVSKRYIDWYDFRNLYLQKVYCLVWYQGPVFLESISPGMISGSCMFRKCIAWYDFRVLNSKKVYCLVWFQDPLSSESINLSPWPCISLVSVLECVSTPPGDFLQIWYLQPKWLSQQVPPRNSVLGAGLNAPISFSSTWNLGEFLEI